MRKLMLTTSIAIALTGLLATGVEAASPEPMSLVVATTFDDLPDDVTVAGGALADDCLGGTTEDTYFHAGPSDEKWPTVSGSVTLQVGKVLHCTSGDIHLRLVVRLDLMTETTSGRWVAVGGTGAYERVSGSGTISGSPFLGGVEDVYSGQIRVS
jgi:hypothetical protein